MGKVCAAVCWAMADIGEGTNEATAMMTPVGSAVDHRCE